jgi:FkbM family methyltransferase
MKQVYNYWMPASDNHFERLIKKRISQGGPAEYQDLIREAAYKYITDFDLCIDVGANVGLFTVPLSAKFKKIIAFEPVDQVYKCLEKNTQHLNVELRKYALGNANSTIDIEIVNDNTGQSFVKNETMGKGSIDIKRMDDLDLPKFGLLKLDCERYELEILKGSIETILKYKPIIIVEQHPDTEFCAGAFLKSHGAVQLDRVKKDYVFGWNS